MDSLSRYARWKLIMWIRYWRIMNLAQGEVSR